jgi:hypothetical protein
MSAEGDMGDMEGLENGAGNGADMLLDDSGAGAADDAVSLLIYSQIHVSVNANA